MERTELLISCDELKWNLNPKQKKRTHPYVLFLNFKK
jgi:hypothetical protein